MRKWNEEKAAAFAKQAREKGGIRWAQKDLDEVWHDRNTQGMTYMELSEKWGRTPVRMSQICRRLAKRHTGINTRA